MTGEDLEPSEYATVLAEAKALVRGAQVRARLAVNSELLGLYWRLGRLIVQRREAEGWGSKVVSRLAGDLRAEFPGMKGLSPRNLVYMATFAGAWPQFEIAQQVAAQLPWGHHMVLLDKLSSAEERLWYAAQAVQDGWSRAVLEHMIASGLHLRAGAAPSNFGVVLPPEESDLAQALTRGPYDLEFLALTAPVAERDLEDALMAHLQRFLLELGAGFAFVGRQFRLAVGDEEFFVDLLFFNYLANRFVVIELKTRKLTPADVGQLNFYVNAIDGEVRQAGHERTIGILLCAARDETVTRYALGGMSTPLAVAGYTHGQLPPDLQTALPDLGELVQPFLAAYQPALEAE